MLCLAIISGIFMFHVHHVRRRAGPAINALNSVSKLPGSS